MKPILTPICTATAMFLTACVSNAQEPPLIPDSTQVIVDGLIAAGLSDDVGLKFVEDLTTEVGPRLAGSEAEARARDWAMRELKELNFQQVYTEHFEIPYWSRVTETAQVTSPVPQKLIITALGGSAATPEGGVEAELVRFTDMASLGAADAADVAGKIVFLDEMMTRTQDGSGYGVAVAKRRNCAAVTTEKGGVACLIRSVGTDHHRMPHTGMMARGEVVGPGPAAALSPPDADQLARLLTRGPVRVNVNIQVETKPVAPSGNVIAEIAGRSNPEEIVVMGCHLDSWDLGTGAIDDAAGCGIVVGAARLIDRLDRNPRRTIRVILFGAEEVGLLGARAYAEAHADNLQNHVFASESDFGAGKIWRFETRFGTGALGYATAMQQVLAPLGITPGNNEANGGPDLIPLRMGGVPVVTPRQNGLDYFDLHHTPDDTFDKINPEDFRQNVAAYAAFIYLAAEMDWNFRAEAPEDTGTE